MTRRKRLILLWGMVFVIPLIFTLSYFNSFLESQHQAQVEERLSLLSAMTKKRILMVLDQIRDNISSISSRTQMRISLQKWNTTPSKQHSQKITKIITDAAQSLEKVHYISIYDQAGDPIATTMENLPNYDLQTLSQNGNKIKLVKRDQVYIVAISELVINNGVVGYVEVAFYAYMITDLVRGHPGLGKTGEYLLAIRNNDGNALFTTPLKFDETAGFRLSIPKNRFDVPITQALLGHEMIFVGVPDYLGNSVVASTRYIGELDIGLVAKIHQAEVKELFKSVQHVIWWSEIVMILLAILCGGCVAMFWGRDKEASVDQSMF